jgi:mRNA interferase MazF
MVDKVTAVPKSKVGALVGQLDDEDVVRLNRVLLVFLGLAGAPFWQSATRDWKQ